MAKQMKRVEKRYVPQQESFRQLPGLRPQAEPQTAVATPAPDGEAGRLRELAESLAVGNKALQDFFTMEKSFEETNRVAQRTRGRLGLPQTEGTGGGFLDWGSDYGYQEGKGLAEGAMLQDRLLQELEENNWFVDEANPNPQKSMTDMQAHIQRFISDNLGAQQNNSAFMQGASDFLVKARVEATVQAGLKLDALKLQSKLGNYGTWATAMLDRELPKLQDPKDVRETLSRLTSESSRFGLSRDAAADHLAFTLQQRYSNVFTEAHDADDVKGMNTAIQEMAMVTKAMGLPDSAGVPFGGVRKDANGRLVQPLDSTRRELDTEMRQMILDREKAVKRINEQTVADKSADLLYRMQTKGLKPGAAIGELNALYGEIPSQTYLELQKFAAEVDRSGMNIVEEPGLYEESLLNIDSLSQADIRKMLADGRLKPENATALFRAKQQILAETNARLAIADKQASLRNRARREEQQNLKEQRDQTFGRWATKMSAVMTPTELDSVKKYWDINKELTSENDLQVLSESTENVRKKREMLKQQADAKKQEASLKAQGLLNDFYVNNPEAKKYNSLLAGYAKDPKHGNMEGLEFAYRNFAYADRTSEVASGGTKEAAAEAARQTEVLFMEALNPEQKAVLKQRTQSDPNYKVPVEAISKYNSMILRKSNDIKQQFAEGSSEQRAALQRLHFLSLLMHPLTSEETKERIKREVKYINQ